MSQEKPTLIHTDDRASTTLHTETTEQQLNLSIQHKQEICETRSLVKRNNEILNTQADLILIISRTVASCATQQQPDALQSMMLKVLTTNMRIYQLVLAMRKVQQTQLSPQVDRQQPVYFEDAHGRVAPFHVEFIDSFEEFQAVMEVRFRHVPGLKKVQRNQYLIHEPGSKRKLKLRAPWEPVFRPGRKVVMSMIFQTPQASASSCPGCQTENEVSNNAFQGEIQWQVFSRTVGPIHPFSDHRKFKS